MVARSRSPTFWSNMSHIPSFRVANQTARDICQIRWSAPKCFGEGAKGLCGHIHGTLVCNFSQSQKMRFLLSNNNEKVGGKLVWRLGLTHIYTYIHTYIHTYIYILCYLYLVFFLLSLISTYVCIYIYMYIFFSFFSFLCLSNLKTKSCNPKAPTRWPNNRSLHHPETCSEPTQRDYAPLEFLFFGRAIWE